MRQSDMPGTFVHRTRIPGQATAGTADVWTLLVADENIKVTAVKWVPDAAVTGDNTNYFSLVIRNEGTDGSGTTALTSTKAYTTGVDSVAQVPESLTMSTTAADVLVDAGEVVSMVRAVAASGLAQPDGLCEVHYQYV